MKQLEIVRAPLPEDYDPAEWMPLEEAADRLQLGKTRIHELAACGRVATVYVPKKHGCASGYRYKRADIEDYANKRGIGQEEHGSPLAESYSVHDALVRGLEEKLLLVHDDTGRVIDLGVEREHKRFRNRQGKDCHEIVIQRADGTRTRFEELTQE